MPKYTILTKQTIEREYDHDLDLPVNMGDSNDRLCDRMIRTAADNGTLTETIAMTEAEHQHGGPDEGPEEIAAIYRDDVRVWPRPRKAMGGKKVASTTVDEIKTPDLEDVAYEDSVSSDT